MTRPSYQIEGPLSVEGEQRRQRFEGVVLSGVVLFIALVLIAYGRITKEASSVALVVLVIAVVATVIRPILGVFAIVFFTLAGDSTTANWFPFAKNLSSRESLLFLSDKLSLSPLEILVVTTVLVWIAGLIGAANKRVVKGPLFVWTAAFTSFIAFGFVVGVGQGGDLRIALFEGRAIFLLLPVYLLIINLCDGRQLRRLMWTAVAGICVNALLSLRYFNSLSITERVGREDLGEHPASVHFNLVFLLVLVMFLYRSGSRPARILLLAMCVPMVMVYLEAQRRGAFVALGVGIGFVLLSLWWRNRAMFLAVAPIVLIVTAGYTAAFWNSQSTAGFPAQAIKTVIAPDQVSEKDQSSDLYRQIENFDINYTVRAAPVLGLGFGHKFLRPIGLPDISDFEFYEYIPHNSILFIWIKAGFGGFVTMMMMFAVAIRNGTRLLMRERDPMSATLLIVSVAFVAMYAVFSFVDISWDPRSMVMLAVAFAFCTPQPKLVPHAHKVAATSVSREVRNDSNASVPVA